MAQTKVYRIAIMAMVLVALFALTAFAADITGGFGVIYGVDETYEAATVTINKAGDGIAVDTENAITLSDANNTGLVGLYAVSDDDFATQTIVYVVGDASERASLTEKWVEGDIGFDGKTIEAALVGLTKHGSGINYFAPGYYTSSHTFYPQYAMTAESHFSNGFVTAFYHATTPEEKQAAVDKYKDGFTNVVYRYALLGKEITPVKNVTSITIGINAGVAVNFGFKTLDNKMKLLAYVMSPDGEVSSHAYYISYPEQIFNGNDYNGFKIDFTNASAWDNGGLPEEGYVVGLELYPFYGLTKAENFEITYTEDVIPSTYGYRARGIISIPTWTVTLPTYDIPSAEVEGTVISGLDSTLTYKVAPYFVAGADAENAKDIPAGTTAVDIKDYFGEDAVGLYGVYVEGDGTTVADSNIAALAYIRGTLSARQDIHEKSDTGYYILSGSEKVPGKFSYVGDWGLHSSFGLDGICSLGNHITEPHMTALYDAYTAEDATDETKKAAFEKFLIDSAVTGKHIQYNFTADEIIPISEVVEYSYSVAKERGGFTYNNQISEFEAIILGADGNIKSYTYQHAKANLGTSVTKIVDFKKATSINGTWVDTLPEEGYLVAFRINLYANIDNWEDVGAINGNGTRYNVTLDKSYVINKPTYEAPTGVTVEGTTIKGLDAGKKYAYAPYYANSVGEAVEIPAESTTFELPEGTTGLIGVTYVIDDEDYTPAPTILYIRPSYSDRSKLHEDNGSGYYKVGTEIAPGVISGPSAATHSIFGTSGVCTTGDHISFNAVKAFYDALNDETATVAVKQNAFNVIASALNSYNYHYEFTEKEIVPISEVNKYSYAVNFNRGNFGYNDQRSRFDVQIMDKTGKVSTYTYIHESDILPVGTDSNSRYCLAFKTVDFNSTENWLDALPTDGYLVGFTVYPFYGIDDYTKAVAYNSSVYGTRYGIVFASEYDIDRYIEDSDEDIVANGATFTGLDANEVYTVAPFTVLGAGEPIATDITGTTTYTIAGDAVGLYGIYPTNNENVKPVITYVAGSFSERANIGPATPAGRTSFDPHFTQTPKTALMWELGEPLGAQWYSSKFSTHDARYTDISTRLLDALNSGDATQISVVRKTLANAMKNVNIRYAYAADEIIPIGEVVTMTVGSANFRAKVTTNAKASLELYIMQADGTISVHTWKSNSVAANSAAWSNHTVNVQKDIPGLPKTGWLVAYRFMPIAEADLSTMTTSATSGTAEFAIYMKTPGTYFSGSYEITIPKAEKPTGITFENNTLSGLTSAYAVAPFVVTGADVENALDVADYASGSYTFNPATQAGLWGIYVPASENNQASDPVIVYVRGSSAERAKLGNIVTKTYTWNSGADSVEYTASDFFKATESVQEWSVGQYAGAEYYIYLGKEYNIYKSDWMYSSASSKALYDASIANDGGASLKALQLSTEAALEVASLRYAYESEEIIPVDEVLEMKFSVGLGTTYVSTGPVKSRYELYVMDANGEVTPYTYYGVERTITGDAGSAAMHETLDVQNDFDLPEEGWIVGYKFYPFADINPDNITHKSETSTATQYAFNTLAPLEYFDGYYTIKEDDHAEFGMSLVLDGKIGVKVTADADATVSGLAVANVVGTDSFVDFGANNYAIFYVNPKDVATTEIAFDITYTDAEGAESESFTLTVGDYVAALKEASNDAEVLALINAFETYYNAAANYFNGVTGAEALADLTEDELADLASKRLRTKSGTLEALEFYSTSLIIEDDTVIRHYFKVIDDGLKTEEDLAEVYTVEGGSAFKIADVEEGSADTYVYTDIKNIASVDLDTVKEVTVTETIIDDPVTYTVRFNALAYVDLCLNDDDANLVNLVKALYRYSVESDAYAAN